MLSRSIYVHAFHALSLSLLLACAAADPKDARVDYAGASTVTGDGGASQDGGSGSVANGANMASNPNNDPMPKPPGGTPECPCDFSGGRWLLENPSPCTIFNERGEIVGMVSTKLDASCPVIVAGAPVAHEGPWSLNSLQVDCAGQFELCYALKAGNADDPKPEDCLVARVCTQVWYPEADVKMTLPALDGWTATDLTCAQRFNDSGGYGEMTVLGESVECDVIDDGGGQPYAFSRSPYCAPDCRDNPDREDCKRCSQGGAGGF